MKKERLFKVLGPGREPCHGGSGGWPPVRVWRKVDGPLVPCKNGLHLCREQDLVYWLGPTIYEAEARGERLDCDDKIVVREARLLRRVKTWNERTARLFACDCAEHVLPIYERAYPGDNRSRACIEIGRRFALGQATPEELTTARHAAWEAAWEAIGNTAPCAAGTAIWGTACDAADVHPENTASEYVVRYAVWHACNAAEADAGVDARAQEHKWQTKRLMERLYPKEEKT